MTAQTGDHAQVNKHSIVWLGLAAAYLCYFGMLGALQPYLAMLYIEHGLATSSVGASVALLYVLAGVAPLLATAGAAHWHVGSRNLFLCSGGAALLLAGLLAVVGSDVSHASYVVLIATFTAAYAPLNALLDTSALKACTLHGWSYGRLRLMGSLGYIATATLLGHILPAHDVSSHVHVAVAALTAVVLATGAFLPNAAVAGPIAEAAPVGEVEQAAPSRLALVCLVCAVGLHYASFGPFQYGFTLYGRSIGLTPASIGLGWSLGVISEVAFFSLAGGWISRWGWRPLLLIAFLFAPLRWAALAAFPQPTTFFVTQLLHGPSFALFYAAAMAALNEVQPGPRAQRSQTIFSALVAGLASGPAMLLAGYAYAYMSLGSMFTCMLPANLLSLVLLMVPLRRAAEFRRAEPVVLH